MRKLACTGCGAPLEWDGVTPVVTCSSCGSRFQMNTSGSRGNWQAAALRGDCVAERPGLERGSTDYGKSYYRCWLPKGWTYRIGTAPLDRAGSAATPFVPTIVLISPDKSANIIHTTTNAFQDPGPLGPMGPFSSMFGGRSGSLGNFGGNGTVGLDGLVHYPNCTLDPQTYTRMRPLITAAQDCDEIAQLNHPGCVFVNEQQPDDVARKRHEQVVADTPEQLRASLWSDWAGRLYRYQDDKGRPCLSLVEVEITTNGFNRQSPEGYGQQAAQAQRTGFFGRMANAMAQNMAQASTPRIWQIDGEVVTFSWHGEWGQRVQFDDNPTTEDE